MTDLPPASAETRRNRFDRMEWAGAFGDLGTLIPFLIAYITLAGMDPLGVLFVFAIALIFVGAWYRTPFPVQPMKAIGAAVVSQGVAVTPATIAGAGLVTGAIWLLLGATGLIERVTRLVSRPVVAGIILGLGAGFMLKGIEMMASHWLIASIALLLTLLMLGNRRLPAMLLLLLFGVVCGVLLNPEHLQRLSAFSVQFRLPELVLQSVGWSDLLTGGLFLALPQLPLTLGNAILAIRQENNRLFPDRPVSEWRVALSTGLMNLFGAPLGGVPMCHGAGGMAGHVAFGARTGGAPIILGGLLLVAALFFSNSVLLLLQLLPESILGVVLFITGAQLAIGCGGLGESRGDRFITLATAAFAIWHVGIAFLVGIGAAWMQRRGWLRI
ncbi:MAG: sulfate transporter [Sedimenticola sp.]|nr:sulfate transporter [Sedimenticola sp.]